MGRPVHHQFLRNALPDLTAIVPVTAYERINYFRDTVGLTDLQTDDYSETKDCRYLSKTSGVIAVCGRKRLFEIFSTIVEGRIQAFSSPIVEEENERILLAG